MLDGIAGGLAATGNNLATAEARLDHGAQATVHRYHGEHRSDAGAAPSPDRRR